MAKASLSKSDVDALLKLRDDVDRQLSSHGRELEGQLSRLGMLQTGLGKGRTRGTSPIRGRTSTHRLVAERADGVRVRLQGAQFRSDVEAFINREVVQACVSVGTYERPPLSGTTYKAFLDFAGGSGQDSLTLAIGHRDGTSVVVDALREIRPPFSPEFAIAQLVSLLKGYKVYTVEGDAFGGEFAREPLKKVGISYVLAKRSKSDLYSHHLLPMLNSGRVDLLDHARAIQQIVGLECHTARAGKDKIDHPPGGHDDLANAIAGLVARAAGGGYDTSMAWIDGPTKPVEDPRDQQERVRRLKEAIVATGRVPDTW